MGVDRCVPAEAWNVERKLPVETAWRLEIIAGFPSDEARMTP